MKHAIAMFIGMLIGAIVFGSLAYTTNDSLGTELRVFRPGQGGTGTSTAPDFGDVLVGLSDGTYAPRATSTLGITALGDGTSNWTFNGTAVTPSTTPVGVTLDGTLTVTPLTSALTLTGAGGAFAEYAGTSCTNQFTRSLSALGVATCETVDISADTNLSADGTEIVLTGDALSLGNSLSFTYASTTGISGTNSFFTTASSTNLYASVVNFGSSILSLASRTMTALGIWDFGGADSLEIPNGTGPTVDATGETAVDTTSDQFVYYGASKKVLGNGNFYPAFTYATTTAWTGTTTIPLGTAYVAETWNGVQCFTDTGTLVTRFGDGTNWTNVNNSSTTVGTTVLSSNNTFTAGEKRYVEVGTPASSPTKISCTVSKSLTAD